MMLNIDGQWSAVLSSAKIRSRDAVNYNKLVAGPFLGLLVFTADWIGHASLLLIELTRLLWSRNIAQSLL